MSFASTHFVPFAMDMGFEEMAAASALGMVGGCAIVGGLMAGFLGDRFPRKNVLAAVYLTRGLAFAVLLQAHDLPTLYFGSFLLGISWTSTSPLTSAITADRCGLTHLGTHLRHDVHDHADRLGASVRTWAARSTRPATATSCRSS